MIVKPKRRKILRFKKMTELGLDSSKIQFLFILDKNNTELYLKLVSLFDNSNVEVNIFSNIDEFKKTNKFNYFNEDLEILFEICESSFMMRDDRILSYDYLIVENIDHLNSLKFDEDLSKSDEVSIVLSHCNTEEKKEILIENLKVLKKQNQKIILTSHIPVENEILKLVDYFICDNKNQLISSDEFDGKGRTFAYLYVPGYHHEYEYDNHAFSVLNLMKMGVELAKSKGYMKSHLIHYDCIIYDQNILKTNYLNLSNDYDIIHYFFDSYPDRLDGNFISIKTDVFYEIFKDINKKSDFVKYEVAMFEEFLSLICYNREFKILSSPIENLFYRNIIDKIKMLDLGIKKFYTDEIYTETFVIPSYDSKNKYLSIFTDDENIKNFKLNGFEFILEKNIVTVLKITDELLKNNLYIEISYINYLGKINLESKFAKCLHLQPELINFYDLEN